MTDDLRDRIAAVLLAHSGESDAGPDCTCGWEWQGYGLWKDCFAAHVADAVIRELALTPEYSYGTTYPNVPVEDRRLVRYVTRWEPAE